MSKVNIFGMPMDGIVEGFAAQLAHADSELQGKFFRVFADELLHSCKTRWAEQQQSCFINRELNDRQRETYAMIGFKETT